jgi:hypothetical protein
MRLRVALYHNHNKQTPLDKALTFCAEQNGASKARRSPSERPSEPSQAVKIRRAPSTASAALQPTVEDAGANRSFVMGSKSNASTLEETY